MTRRSKVSPALTVPERIGFPAPTVTGSASPVRADSSITAWPTATSPSVGTTSPALTTTTIARLQLVDADRLDASGGVAVSGAGRSLDESAQFSTGTAGGPGLERGAARHHECDDRGCELLPEYERPDDRDERDRVDADIAAEQRPHRVSYQRHEHDHRPNGPDPFRPDVASECVRNPAGNDGRQSEPGDDSLSHRWSTTRLG